MDFSIPAGVLWSGVIGVGSIMLGSYVLGLHNKWRIGGKVDETDCTQRHSDLRAEQVAQGKDIEYLVKAAGGDPTPRPRNGDSID